MIDLTTRYLGLKLRTPLVASASPLSQEIGGIRRLEEAGASAIVLSSLFEEQLHHEEVELERRLDAGTHSFAEAITYLPQSDEFCLGPDGYLKHIEQAKKAVAIPIVASLNGSSIGGWTRFAKQIEDAGADAIECNIYFLATDPGVSSNEVEQRYLDIARAVKSAVSIPVAVKISPFFSNMANMAKRFDEAKVDGLVLFNRFYQPDINIEELEMETNVLLSTPQELRLPLTWIGILYGRIGTSLAATSGVHQHEDVIKLLMAGADVTMLCSTLLRNGIAHIRQIERALVDWMEEHEYASVQQMKGSMSQIHSADPGAFERAQYMKAVKSVRHVQVTGREAWAILSGR